jgi:ribonuclease VapC
VILDASVIAAAIFEEPEREAILDRIDRATVVSVGAPTLVETTVVTVTRLGADGRAAVRAFLDDTEIGVLPFGEREWRVAADAFVRYGKGRHPARLNFGDCLAYAAASSAGRPLFALGRDFAQTDLELVEL